MGAAFPRDTDAELDRLLSGLNEPQRAAVLHGEGPLLILAGAGSGKTRVLTHRIAYLLATGQARPDEILAITFTNKAAQEMRERVELLVGARTRAMWLMTFHAACARMLRADAHRLGYTRQFTIYDQADARRLVKRCIEELDVDPKRFAPGAIHHEISDAKNKLRDAESYGELVGSYFEQTVVDVYRMYESELHRMNAMDFDDLLVRAVNVMELFPEVRERYASAFRHVLVDEYQDTNHVQYRWLQLIAGEHRNIAVVGDDDQCLVEGTLVTMADGTPRPIERIAPGDEVLSCCEGADMGPARVLRTHRSERAAGVRITLRSGRELVSTPEHTHFAGFRGGEVQVLPPIGGKLDTHRGGAAVALAVRSLGVPLPALPASAVRPGMAMVTANGGYDVVVAVERIELDRPVYDLDVEGTHNFVANGLITHNSIYGFRGADVRNILDFEDDFPDAKVVKLEQNYRSTQMILDAANAVIANNRGRMGKALWTDLGAGDPIHLRELEDEHAEARFVAGEIERLVDEGTSRNEIAVFYRTNAQSRVLEDTLVRAQIGYQVIGGTKFYERAEIKDAIAYLTALVNPQDVVAFGRIVNSPRRGIGATSFSRVVGWANTAGITIWDAAAEPESVPGLGTAAVKAFHRFMGAMRVLRERAESDAPIAQLLNELLRETGYLDALEAERTIEAQGRIENLEELVNVAAEYDVATDDAAGEEGEPPSLAGFLQQIALVADADARRDDEGLVTLMTLHNAKGLEYPIVFMIGCEEGVFPHARAIDEGGLEEERRLAYVGITRAQRDLYVTYARTRAVFGARHYGAASRFVGEIPAGLTDRPAGSSPGGVRERALSWSAGGGIGSPSGGGSGGIAWASAGGGGDAGLAFRLGEDVAHPAFGEGVVTGVEAGGIVVIRFSRDGSERKLVADLAPITRR
jgi:superfamily I DNA/RNA helicase